LEIALSDKNVLENNLRLIGIDLNNVNNQVRLLEEHIRRLQTGINDTVSRLNDADAIIDRIKGDIRLLG
jgi:peptidoglycan hydrolase CwlO-like protein